MRARTLRLIAVLACAALASGCVAKAGPATSVPLESIAPRPDPVSRLDTLTVVGYELRAIHLGTRFAGSWDDTAESTLREMGFEPADGAFERADEASATVEPDDAGGFWLNLSYRHFDEEVFAPTLDEASEKADEEWVELEPHFLGTLGHFTERTGAEPQGPTQRALAFHARLAGQTQP